MSRPRPRDHAQRERAVLARDANVVVLAGAGSGKTSLLCERVLHLVIGRGIDAARIAAITFTENAASQMRDRLAAAFDGLASGGSDVPVEAERVRVRLASAGSFPVAAAEIRRRARAALAALDRASIATIHGFCARLLRRHPCRRAWRLASTWTPTSSAIAVRATSSSGRSAPSAPRPRRGIAPRRSSAR
ncbi:MAG: UvrD-helicase domain-containing protein [Acidobacteriota bacterium]